MDEVFHDYLVEELQGFQFLNLPHLEHSTCCMTYHGRTRPYEYIFVSVRLLPSSCTGGSMDRMRSLGSQLLVGRNPVIF